MRTIGEKIRWERRRRALALDDLAALTGVSKPYLSLIENGKVPPPRSRKLASLDNVLGFGGALVRQAAIERTPPEVLALLPAGAAERFIAGRGDFRVAFSKRVHP